MTTKDKIEKILRKEFSPKYLEVIDDSDKHAGHAGAKQTGGGHFSVIIVSKDFEGKKPLERHRLIYTALQSLKSQIHALAIQAQPNHTPGV